MTRISVELVPREKNALIEELEMLNDKFPMIDIVNIPDILRFNMRSWEACTYARIYNNVIPHIRAIDMDANELLPVADFIQQAQVDEVLVVAGDIPPDYYWRTYNTSSIEIIKKFKREVPGIKVYAAIDQYRQSIRSEYDYVMRKIDAGADGFFTQPFFDLHLIEYYIDILPDTEIFFGVTPVTTEKSQSYWENRNKALFPKDFEPTMEWNVKYAKDVLDLVKKENQSIYFMPITIPVYDYLNAVLGKK